MARINVTGLAKYTPEEIKKFDKMHEALTEFNEKLETPEELPMPPYSDEEMFAYSGYREMLIERKFNE